MKLFSKRATPTHMHCK